MRKILYVLFAVVVVVSFSSCDDYETYGEKKEIERDAIKAFIRDSSIVVISQSKFEEQGNKTDVSKNEFVFLDNSGVYMQIVRKGCGEPLPDGRQTNVLCRYYEYNILDQVIQTRNDYSPRVYDKMTVKRVGTTYTASFASGMMFSSYGASVPSGWLVPFNYINVGRQTNPDDEIAMVKLIVPHTQGQAYASSSVYPCYYVITYQSEK